MPIDILEEKSIAPSLSIEHLQSLIYQGAKQENKAMIDSALRYCSLHILNKSMTTVAFTLATENTPQSNKALNFLIDNYPEEKTTLLRWMVFGYARQGDLNQAFKIMHSTNNPTERFVFLKQLVRGHMYNGPDISKAIELLHLTQNPLERYELMKPMLYGYASGGHKIHAKEVLNLAKNSAERLELVAFLAHALAGFGDNMSANACLKEAPERSHEWHYILEQLMMGYAKVCNITEAKQLLFLYKNDQILKNMAYGLAFAGHLDAAYQLLEEIPDNKNLIIEGMINGLASAGNFLGINILFIKIERISKTQYYLLMGANFARYGHITLTNNFINQNILNMVSNHDKIRILSVIACQYASNGNEPKVKALYDLMMSLNPNEWKNILIQLVKKYISVGFVIAAKNLIAYSADQVNIPFILEQISRCIANSKVSLDNNALLFLCSVFAPSHHQRLLSNINEAQPDLKIHLEKMTQKSSNLYHSMVKFHPITFPINYRWAAGTQWIQLQEWLLLTGRWINQNKTMHNDMFLLIATYIASINFNEAKMLSMKLTSYRHHLFSPTAHSQNAMNTDTDLKKNLKFGK